MFAPAQQILRKSHEALYIALQLPAVRQMWNIHSTAGLATLNHEVTRQAAMIAYIDDFKLMMVLTLATIPFLLLIKRAKPQAGSTHPAVLE